MSPLVEVRCGVCGDGPYVMERHEVPKRCGRRHCENRDLLVKEVKPSPPPADAPAIAAEPATEDAPPSPVPPPSGPFRCANFFCRGSVVATAQGGPLVCWSCGQPLVPVAGGLA